MPGHYLCESTNLIYFPVIVVLLLWTHFSNFLMCSFTMFSNWTIFTLSWSRRLFILLLEICQLTRSFSSVIHPHEVRQTMKWEGTMFQIILSFNQHQLQVLGKGEEMDKTTLRCDHLLEWFTGPTEGNYTHSWASLVQLIKNVSANAGDTRVAGSVSAARRSPGEGKGYPLQYSGLENPMDNGMILNNPVLSAWQTTVRGGHEQSDAAHTHTHTHSLSLSQLWFIIG